MQANRSAAIIPFPARAHSAPPAPHLARPPAEDDATQRLKAALAALERAVAGQREAVARWRGALGELGGSMQGLNTSLRAYDTRLGTLRGQLDGITAEARALEAWADSALEAEARDNQPK
jgi:hypothetical protein